MAASAAMTLLAACGSAPLEEDTGSAESALSCPPGYVPVCEFDTDLKKMVCTECAPKPKTCAPGTVQAGTQCVACGKIGQPVCADNSCEPGSEGPTGYCTACGTSGAPPCIWKATCGPDLQVTNGVCTPCGLEGTVACSAGSACVAGLEPSRLGNVCGQPWGANGQRCGEGGGCKPRLVCAATATCVPEPTREPREDEGCGGLGESCCTDPVYTRACIGNNECKSQFPFGNWSDTCVAPVAKTGGGSTGGGATACGTPKTECGSCSGAGEFIVQRSTDDALQCSTDGQAFVVTCTTACPKTQQLEACGYCPPGFKVMSREADPVKCQSLDGNVNSPKVLCQR